MTDVLAPVLIPYARFLEVRARRLDIVTELTQPNGQRPTKEPVPSGPIVNNERSPVAVHVVAADAMHTTKAAVEEGIVPGGGVALLRACTALSGPSPH